MTTVRRRISTAVAVEFLESFADLHDPRSTSGQGAVSAGEQIGCCCALCGVPDRLPHHHCRRAAGRQGAVPARLSQPGGATEPE